MFPDDPGDEEVRATVHGWKLTRVRIEVACEKSYRSRFVDRSDDCDSNVG
jgi:hypothetical protein